MKQGNWSERRDPQEECATGTEGLPNVCRAHVRAIAKTLYCQQRAEKGHHKT